jgi:hypothetical protein
LWTANNGGEATQVTPDEDKVYPITIEELPEVIRNIKVNYKYAPKSFLFKFLDFLNICWIYGHIPEEWRIAVIVPIYKKKGDRKNCDNYRDISLLNTGYKIYAKIITQRLMTIAEVIILEEQNGFRKYRKCMDCIFSISQIIEKHKEYNIPTYIAFIDLEKAFDTVNRAKV